MAPYLVNKRKVPYQEASNAINEWLYYKCDKLKRLDSSSVWRIYALEYAKRKGLRPLKFDTLKQRNRQLYDQLVLLERQHQQRLK